MPEIAVSESSTSRLAVKCHQGQSHSSAEDKSGVKTRLKHLITNSLNFSSSVA